MSKGYSEEDIEKLNPGLPDKSYEDANQLKNQIQSLKF